MKNEEINTPNEVNENDENSEINDINETNETNELPDYNFLLTKEYDIEEKLGLWKGSYFVGLLLVSILYSLFSLGNEEIGLIARVFGAFFWFGLIPGISAIVRKIIGKPQKIHIYQRYMVISGAVFVIFLLLQLNAFRVHYENQKIEALDTASKVYDAIEYTVQMPRNATISEIESSFDTLRLKGQRVLSINSEEKSVCSIEYTKYPADYKFIFKKETILEILAEFEKISGIQNGLREYSENELGKIGILSGTKEVTENSDSSFMARYEYRYIIGDSAVLIMSNFAPVEVYPTRSIKSFIKSVKKKVE